MLVNEHAPDRHEIQMLALRKLAHIDESGIPFGLSWTYEQVDEKLRQLFPELFDYLDSTSPVYGSDMHRPNCDDLDSDQPLPPWLLCFRKRHSLKIVPEFFPTGHVLDFNTGTTRAGYRQSNLLIGVPELYCCISMSKYTYSQPNQLPALLYQHLSLTVGRVDVLRVLCLSLVNR